MYIEEITIDGFKSYAKRVTISNLDPAFNAITGLNGSGKSNILDSVCFVLGIKNLSSVRAANLQELVYKQGQAGVTKATVSITFHNDKPAQGPTGYEDKERITVSRQVVIGGRDKYRINGAVATAIRVQDLFHSVQLNVNNPHFLIMQGRITKVLNMKPPEILSLLEEAAGTRMYEKKKDGALKTLQKKELKLQEITELLEKELQPNLERLRRERDQYIEWQTANQSFDKLKRFCVAYSWASLCEAIEAKEEACKAAEAEAEELTAKRQSISEDIASKRSDIKALEVAKALQADGEAAEAAQAADDLAKALVSAKSAATHAREAVDTELSNASGLEASLTELSEEGLAARLAEAEGARDAAREAAKAAVEAAEGAEAELTGAQVGDGRDSSNRSLAERVADAKNTAKEAESEVKQAGVRLKHLEKALKEARKALASSTREAADFEARRAQARADVESLRSQLSAMGYDPAAAAAAESALEAARADVRAKARRAEDLAMSLARVDFQYRDPERNFDRSRVKGVVARLVRVQDLSCATALEVAAGGKLYQVVVDSDGTGKALLARGQLRSRVTIIPLNKVRSNPPSHGQVSQAQRLVGDRAAPALQLVCFQQDVEAAISYVFGSTFVCKDKMAANTISRELRLRAVTLEGDDYNPNGLLTGGSRGKGAPTLARLAELHAAEEELYAARATLAAAEEAQRAGANAAAAAGDLSRKLELQEHALVLLEERIAASESAAAKQTVEDLQAQLAKAGEEVETAKAAAAAAKEEVATLTARMKSFESERGALIKAAEKKVKATKKAAESAKAAVKEAERNALMVEAEVTDAKGERANLVEQLAATKKTVEGLQKEADELAAKESRIAAEAEAAATRLAVLRERLADADAEIARLVEQCDAAVTAMSEAEAEARAATKRCAHARAEGEENAEKRNQLELEHPWIESESRFFGTPGSDYNWTERDPARVKRDYLDCATKVSDLGKGINRKVMAMYEKCAEEYNALVSKKDIVDRDRTKIHEVIAELDAKKKEAIETTWQKVNKDFGSIFSTLLPGTQAKLEPPEGMTCVEGLEVCVAFGGVWKDSLAELSGGQRSLLALSLILALLLFKPAPIYILDEVDAALDLSHTQNIGHMIKTHFPHSQFLVVSLKEGMFNNANVIFRTKFVDGVSSVARTVPGSASAGRGPKGAAARAPRPALRENVQR